MKKLALILLALFLGTAQAQSPVGPPNQILCNKAGQATVASATTTSVVNGVSGASIFICGWHVTSNQSASSTFQLVQGTQGGPCTSPSAVTPAFNVTSTAPSADHVDYAQLQLSAGAQLCVVTTGAAVGAAVLVWYNQF